MTFHSSDRVLVATTRGPLPGVIDSEPEPGVFRVILDVAELPALLVLARALQPECDPPHIVITSTYRLESACLRSSVSR